MSNQLEASQAEVVIPAGEKTSVTDKPEMNVENEDNIQIGPISSRTLRKGVPETFLGPSPENRYLEWQDQIREIERTQPEFDKWKSTFEARMQRKAGTWPTPEEIAAYRTRCEQRERKLYDINAFKESFEKEFKVTTLPKNIPEALELLDRMKPWRRNMIRPKGYREGLALAAPGGVVDEEELDTDALFVQQFMMAEKQKALEEEGKSGEVSKADGSKKNNKNGKWKSQVKNAISSEESKGGGEGNDRIIPIEETLWYSPPHFPRLAKALLQVASQLERRIGTERAIASLHTALTDEALNAETAAQTLICEGEHYFWKPKGDRYVTSDDHLMLKAAGYFERSAALGHDPALFRAGTAYHLLRNPVKARPLLVEAFEKGVAEVSMYTILGLYYLTGEGGPADGEKADFYLSHPLPGDNPFAQRQRHIIRSRLYTYGLDPIKPDTVLAFAFIREALLIDASDSLMEWYDFYTLARGYRYGLVVETDPVKALSYYNKILDTYKSCKNVLKIAEPHLLHVLREAREYKEMMKRGKDSLLKDPQERATRFKLYLAALRYYPKHPQPFVQCYLGLCYYNGDGVKKDLNMAKEYLIKASHHPKHPMPKAICCLALLYAEEKNYEEMMKYIARADEVSDQVNNQEAMTGLYTLAVNYCMDMMQEGKKAWGTDLLKYCDKLILDKDPSAWFCKGQMYLLSQDNPVKKTIEKALCCFLNAEKLLPTPPKRADKTVGSFSEAHKLLLGKLYYMIGICYAREVINDEEKADKAKPLNPTKGIVYLEKAAEMGNGEAYYPLARAYFSTRVNKSKDNPGNPMKALPLYKKAFDYANERGPVPSIIVCEYGHLMLMGFGGVDDVVTGLEYLEMGTQYMLDNFSRGDMSYDTKEDVLTFAARLMHIYTFGSYGVPKDLKKAIMYMEHRKRIGGTKEIKPETEAVMRRHYEMVETVNSMKSAMEQDDQWK